MVEEEEKKDKRMRKCTEEVDGGKQQWMVAAGHAPREKSDSSSQVVIEDLSLSIVLMGWTGPPAIYVPVRAKSRTLVQTMCSETYFVCVVNFIKFNKLRFLVNHL